MHALHGLARFAAIAGGLVYVLLGGSRFAIVSPTSSSAAILAAALGVQVAVANCCHEAWKWKKVKRKTDKDDALKLAKLAVLEPSLVVVLERNGELERLASLAARWGEAYFYADKLRIAVSNVQWEEIEDDLILGELHVFKGSEDHALFFELDHLPTSSPTKVAMSPAKDIFPIAVSL